jgi:cytochrome c-type biogenesis protein CcmH/NrfF
VSRSIRGLVLREVRAGKSDDEIIAAIQNSYPNTSLLPAASGLGLVAWGVPVVAFVLAVAGLGAAYARSRREPRQVATPDDEALVAEARRDG